MEKEADKKVEKKEEEPNPDEPQFIHRRKWLLQRPVKPIKSSHISGKRPEDMTQGEFEEWRMNHGARR